MTDIPSAERAAVNVFIIMGTIFALLGSGLAFIDGQNYTEMLILGYSLGLIQSLIYYIRHKDQHSAGVRT
jgi:hypothetical protein